MDGIPPYQSVRVNFSNNDYDNVCDTFGRGFDRRPAWRDLGILLAHRPGWHFNVVNHGEALWALGVLGEGQLTIYVDEKLRFHCCDHNEDTDFFAPDVQTVENWLSGREEAARKPSPTALEFARAENWKYFKGRPFQLRVSWSDGTYSASLPDLDDATFGHTLADAVHNAAEMICQLFGAPTEITSELTISAELDESAVRQLRT
ncbi:type II toxin-antitoxin system HicB family antitoxin [Streptomyces microflavus]|uniref:type II toxin-antitoxin system HicB family antitoxin n=1 Tax=Streptomyces microflavus TaxID=1919 RepID=UPI0037F7106B